MNGGERLTAATTITAIALVTSLLTAMTVNAFWGGGVFSRVGELFPEVGEILPLGGVIGTTYKPITNLPISLHGQSSDATASATSVAKSVDNFYWPDRSLKGESWAN